MSSSESECISTSEEDIEEDTCDENSLCSELMGLQPYSFEPERANILSNSEDDEEYVNEV